MTTPAIPMPVAQPAQAPATAPAETPTFSGDALAGLVQNAVRGVIEEQKSQAQREQAQQAQARAAQAQSQDLTQNPVFQTVAPVIAPALQQVAMKADAAMDAINFYGTYPDAAKYRGEIEQMFQGEMQKGRPLDRQSLWFHFRGNPANAARLQQDYDAMNARVAQQSATVGAGTVGRSDGATLSFGPDTSVAQMRDALKGVSF